MQLLREVRTPLPTAREHPQRSDDEYQRPGTAAVFLFCEPLASWHRMSVRARRTKLDWAHEVAALLEGRPAHCSQVTLVLDNLDTPVAGAL